MHSFLQYLYSLLRQMHICVTTSFYVHMYVGMHVYMSQAWKSGMELMSQFVCSN